MKQTPENDVERVEPVELPEVEDLEPITIGEVTELTGGGGPCRCDLGNIVWGS